MTQQNELSTKKNDATTATNKNEPKKKKKQNAVEIAKTKPSMHRARVQ